MVRAFKKSHLPEMVSLSPRHNWSFCSFIQIKPGTTGLNYKESHAQFTFAINKIACGVVDLLESLLLRYVHLHDVRLEENIPGPVYDHVELAADGGNLHQVHSSPEEPGDQAREFKSIDFSHPVVVADSSQKSLGAKVESPGCLSPLEPN